MEMRKGCRVVLVEFREGRPFDVVVADGDGHLSHFDCEWSKCYEELLCFESGGGGGPIDIDSGDYWVANASPASLVVQGGGNRLAELPAEWPIERILKARDTSQLIYCKVCDDWFPDPDTDHACDHVHWCEDHAMWDGEGSDDPCGCHKRKDGDQ